MGVTLQSPYARQQDGATDPGHDLPEEKGHVPVGGQFWYAAVIFFSAFLLFQVQLLLGKQILPHFGGAPAVWTACLLTFQVLLLAGYGYSHCVAARLSLGKQVVVHTTLVGVSLAVLASHLRGWATPITPATNSTALSGGDPTWAIVRFLLTAIGLPFFLLSATSPLLQHWFAQTAPGRSPYRLYSVSNLGSLLGLLSYPFLVEPNLRLRTQGWMWFVAYGLLVLLYCFCARSTALCATATTGQKDPVATESVRLPPLGWRRPLLWTSLAAFGSVLLLATTNFICQEIAVIPFLWVLPLSLYLLSFVACFESERWYRRELFHALFAMAAGSLIVVTLPGREYPYLLQIGAASALLFAGCMVFHGEANRARPGAGLLTSFYLCISIGGALGGVFVTLIAPRVFPGYWEFGLGVLACAGLILTQAWRDSSSWLRSAGSSLGLAILAPVVVLAHQELRVVWGVARGIPNGASWTVAAILVSSAALLYARARLRKRSAGSRLVPFGASLGFVVLAAGLAIPQNEAFFNILDRSRNFYGLLTVVEQQPENYISLFHGKTIHGMQFRDPHLARFPAGYYGPHSGVSVLLSNWPRHPIRVGIAGVGTGALAGFGLPGDVYRFYEINPGVMRYSEGDRPYFTYIKNSQAKVEVVMGDARLSLEREALQGKLQVFDILILDAFSSDAVPMHLLTREAFETYLRHLRGPDSVIVAHISNKSVDLGPVLAGIARDFQLHAVRTHPTWKRGFSSRTDWILLSRSPTALSAPELREISVPFPDGLKPILWTDDYSDLFRVLR